ncbi:MAG: DUF3604 domain-containing protein [Rhodobacteraceae bacterium]|nr:DUF3604 domain-containing protein [Paracoccaceae bacterium]
MRQFRLRHVDHRLRRTAEFGQARPAQPQQHRREPPSALRIVRSSIAATASIIPTVIVSDRWYDSVFFGIDRPEGLPASQQERAYTSPIWYTPE